MRAATTQFPDLARMSDNQIGREIDYLRRQIQEAENRLKIALRALENNEPPLLPAWVLREDLNYHLDRYEAVLEEYRYRKDAMQ